MKNLIIKKRVLLFVATCLTGTLILTGCGSNESETSSKPTIVTSFYPLEFAANRIAGDLAQVSNITPQGAEPHDIELTPSLTQDINDADLAIVMGADFQPAIEKATEDRKNPTLNVFESIEEHQDGKASAVSFKSHGDEDHSDDKSSEDGHSHGDEDPHIWLDPVEFSHAVEEISDAIVKILPDNKVEIEENRDELLKDLEDLNIEFETGLASCEISTFVTSHDAFSYLAKRYDLTQESIAGISPENEPSPARLDELEDLVKEKGIEIVFTEELVSEKVAKTLSSEAGVRTEVLSPIEGLTQEQINDDLDYFDLMRANLSQLEDALRCDAAT